MGGSSSGGGGNSGGGGGGNRRSTPKKAAPKKSNNTSRYFKKTSAPTPKAKKKVAPRTGHPSARPVTKPKVVVKPKAVTKPLASPKITKSSIPVNKGSSPKKEQPKPFITSNAQRIDPKEEVAGKGPVPIISAPKSASKPASSINYNTDDASSTTKSKQSSVSVTAVKPAAPKSAERINLSADNKTVAAEPKYNQAYWADQRAKGVSQADMKAEQDKVGIKKAYSGDKVVTADMKRRAADDLKRVTGSMATIQNKGVTKTEEKSGLLGEKLDTTYDYKGGPSIVTRATDPTIGGVRFGEKTSTTFVDGTEVATKTGHDPLGYDAKVTRPDIAGNIDDTQPIDPAKTAENIKSIDAEIKNETDPVKLKALHKRRLMLMRMRNTNTRFAGLLDDADTKRSILTSIR